MTKPKVIFMGSKPGAVAVLRFLLERGWNIHAVVVSGEKEYNWYSGETLTSFSNSRGIRVSTQEELDSSESVDYVLSYMFRNKVKKEVLGMASKAAVNFHAAPLPEYGGWATYNRAILDSANSFGVTCHHMIGELDAGPILKIRRFPIESNNMTGKDLESLAQIEMVKLFADLVINNFEKWEIPSVSQNPQEKNYVNFEEMQELKIIPNDADHDTEQLKARAFWFPPHLGAHYVLNFKKIEIVPDIVKKRIAREIDSNLYSTYYNEIMNYLY
jgi:methionyl-tRNA formyltransferase